MPLTETTTPPPNEASAILKYWQAEIAAARKREKDWRKDAQRILRIYEGEKAEESDKETKAEAVPYNILFSNTETLLPALYSAQPRPVVQRRFKDDDPLGKLAAQAGMRGLEFLIDTNLEGYETFDQAANMAVLDGLLPGRANVRIKYDAKFGELAAEQQEAEPTPYTQSELVCVETIIWDRILYGYAKKWSKVPWIAFEHHVDKKEFIRLFGEEKAATITFMADEVSDREKETPKDDERDKGERKTVLIYEIWDREDRDDGARKVRYLCDQYLHGYLKVEDDPLQLTGFFPVPRPLQFIAKSNNLLPTPLYALYENQAKELNKLTRRINHIVESIKARGIYDSQLGETLETLFQSAENQLIPTEQNATLVAQGGIDKSIWFAPVEKLIVVLTELYRARESCKQVIYEITGIADIIRGSSVASETLGAQQIKERWGTMRLKRMQKEVQRYVRDLLRMMLEIAATKFSEETWAKMTGLPFLLEPKFNELTALANTLRQQAATEQMMGGTTGQAQQQLQQVMQQLQTPKWADVLAMLRDDTQRAYRIDIETNSTVEPEASEDQKQISEVLVALGQALNGIGPLVEKGVLPFQAAQVMLLTIARRYRFGVELEDTIKAMQAPKPQDDGKQGEMMQRELQMQQQHMQMQAQNAQLQTQLKQSEAEKHLNDREAGLKLRELAVKSAEHELELKAQLEQEKLSMRDQTFQTKRNADDKVRSIKEQGSKREEQVTKQADTRLAQGVSALQSTVEQLATMQAQLLETVAQQSEQTAQRTEQLIAAVTAPRKKKAIRGKDGRLEAVEETVA